MELWIRSQDKEILVKANALWIMENQIWMEVPFYENHKRLGLTITGNNHKLAQYKTKERALEVLDEIQNIITIDATIEGIYEKVDLMLKKMVENSTRVYEMPQE